MLCRAALVRYRNPPVFVVASYATFYRISSVNPPLPLPRSSGQRMTQDSCPRIGARLMIPDKESLKKKHKGYPKIHARYDSRYDWTTGVPDNGNEWRKFRVVPRSHPLRPLVCTLFTKGGNRRAFRLPGEGGDHFHCTVEPLPGHIRCR